jgi:hypothetical protein
MFFYDPRHQLAVCGQCRLGVLPGTANLAHHLRWPPNCLVGSAFASALALLQSFDLKTLEELQWDQPRLAAGCPAIRHLALYPGYACLEPSCRHLTRSLQTIQKHIAGHGYKPRVHQQRPLWRECLLQTYFTRHGRTSYFLVLPPIAAAAAVAAAAPAPAPSASGSRPALPPSEPLPLTTAEQALFIVLASDACAV